MFEYLNELWVNDEVREFATWAREQDEYPLDELWFVISKSGSGDETVRGLNLDPRKYPKTWRLN